MNHVRLVVAGLSLLGLAACQTTPRGQIPAPPAAMPEIGAPFPGSREYRVVAEESLLQILVFRGGSKIALFASACTGKVIEVSTSSAIV